MNVFVLTHFPSPYQVEYLNEIAAQPDVRLTVAYLFSRDASRKWTTVPIRHEARILDGAEQRVAEAVAQAKGADLAIFNYYNDPVATYLLRARAEGGGPWVFWGERPGFLAPSWAGRLARRWKLRWLHASPAPIWGIGGAAVEAYSAEFGGEREYRNIPYFSDLARFASIPRAPSANGRTIVFAGALIARKGIDLLANAFAAVTHECAGLRLRIVGDGEMRARVEERLRPLGDRVDFVGFRDWDRLPEVYSGAAVLCVPSRYDGWGLVVPEGLASGLPVIGTDRMGAAIDLLQTGRNGWLIRAGDGAALEAALRDAATLPTEQLAAMSAMARASASDHTLARGVERFVQAAREAIVGWGGRAGEAR